MRWLKKARYAVTTRDKIIGWFSGTTTSAEKAELAALLRALELAKGNKCQYLDRLKICIWDCAYGWCYLERTEAINLPRNTCKIWRNNNKTVRPKEIAIKHCKAHQSNISDINMGNSSSDTAAKNAAEGAFLQLITLRYQRLMNEHPKYQTEVEKLAFLLKGEKNKAGWWATPNNQVIVPQPVRRKIVEDNQTICWASDAIINSLRLKF